MASPQQNQSAEVVMSNASFSINSERWALYAILMLLPACVLIASIIFITFILCFTPWGCKNFYARYLGRPLLHSLPPAEGIGLMETLRGTGQPRLMSRFFTQDELQAIYKMPLPPSRGLDLTVKERKILSSASSVRCSRIGRDDSFDYFGYLGTKED